MGPDLRFAHELADAADAITLARFRALDLRVETKPDLSPVSEADRAAEEAIRLLVGRDRDGEGVFGEELGDDGGAVRWIVDPIDGTRNYVRGSPVWGTLIALERDGRRRGRASPRRRRSGGAGGRPAARAPSRGPASGCTSPRSRGSRIAPSRPRRRRRCRRPGRELAARAWTSRALGDFWQHCLVAEGALDIATDEQLQLWDYAAVALIVEEAGGRCSTFAGEPPAPGRSFLSASAAIHPAAVAALTRGR